MNKINNKKIEFGDWQTPLHLAQQICTLLSALDLHPKSVVEPTCGDGAFICTTLNTFPSIEYCFGLDISKVHLNNATENTKSHYSKNIKTDFIQADFFGFDWNKLFNSLKQPFLVIGNPPWVTNSTLSCIDGKNIPHKHNFHNHKGIEAITGKSNFDISESMLITILDNIKGKDAYFAMICKNTVARKILDYCNRNLFSFDVCKMYNIDAQKHFNAAVDACVLCLHANKLQEYKPLECSIYANISDKHKTVITGFRNNRLIANIPLYEKHSHLVSDGETSFRWRSGVKHDCAKVMELHKTGNNRYQNSLKQQVELENKYLFPMLKSSDLANGKTKTINRYMLVPQLFIGQPTDNIKNLCPKTWQYLLQNRNLFSQRASIIYKKNPEFSVFGVGSYTFSNWKIAISGFYKTIRFRLIGPYEDKPVVFDDTCYFLSCKSKKQAEFIYELLSSDIVKEFYSAYIWQDSKRPITLEILNLLSIEKLAKETKICNSSYYDLEDLNIMQHQLTMF